MIALVQFHVFPGFQVSWSPSAGTAAAAVLAAGALPSTAPPLLASACCRSDEEISDQEADPTNCYWVIFQPGVSKSSLQCGHRDACDGLMERVTKGRDKVITLVAAELPVGSRSCLQQKHIPGLGVALSAT